MKILGLASLPCAIYLDQTVQLFVYSAFLVQHAIY